MLHFDDCESKLYLILEKKIFIAAESILNLDSDCKISLAECPWLHFHHHQHPHHPLIPQWAQGHPLRSK